MDERRNSSWMPALVVALLWLPLFYVGTYLAMVTPNDPAREFVDYRFGEEWASRVYWPLEQIDRRLLPGRWMLPRGYFTPIQSGFHQINNESSND